MLQIHKKLLVAFFSVLFMGLFNIASAQYLGPSQEPVLTTVSEVLKNPVDDQEVVLRGQIIKKIKKKHYEFKDSTGTIRTEIDHKLFYNTKITDKSIVEIYGEVDKHFLKSPEIDVKKLTIITP